MLYNKQKMWDKVIGAFSCEFLYKYVLNAMRCESSCGWCSCACETDEIDVDSNDAEFRAQGCCGSVEYIDD